MAEPKPARNLFFPLTILFGGLFSVTILALLAAIVGDPHAPLAQFLDRFAGWLLTVETLGALSCAFLALLVDRRQSLATRDQPEPQPVAGVELKKDVATE
jgi:hypothetical protein